VNEYNWKQLIQPYVKNQDMYKDTVNPAARWSDIHSDTAARTFFGWTPAQVPPELRFNRGYAIANIFINGSFADNKGVSVTGLEDVAKVMNVLESKTFFEDMGPYLSWIQNVDSDTAWLGAANPNTGLQWNWGGDKWSNKAMAVGFQDGHAKRLAFSAICGASFMKKTAGDTSVDHWGLSYAEQAGYSWADTMCVTMPPQFK
jgi:hypothetical protein